MFSVGPSHISMNESNTKYIKWSASYAHRTHGQEIDGQQFSSKGSNYSELLCVYCWYTILRSLYMFNPSRVAVSAVLLIWCTIKYCRIPFIHLPHSLSLALCVSFISVLFFAKNNNNRLRIEINESKTDYNAYLVEMKRRTRKGSSVSCILHCVPLRTNKHIHKQSSFAQRMKRRKVKI